MGLSADKFIKTNLKHGTGFGIDVYKQEFSIVSGFESKDGQINIRWVYPQKDRKPSDKVRPNKITLGNRQQAIQRLEQLIHFIEQIKD
uniref:Transcriptional coactivator p15 (PC4) C-terminal domain-containing protein n=1 Tax=viral metagenome TaxID=1070528 RepID=A0A6M3JQP5_9ZZZZ